jgi:hypothetical protein
MNYRTRLYYYTETDKALMWERWRQGESLHAIAQLFDRNHSAIGGILAPRDDSRCAAIINSACRHTRAQRAKATSERN